MVEIIASEPPVRRTLTTERLDSFGALKCPNRMEELLKMPGSSLQVLSGVPVTVEQIGSARERDISVNLDPLIHKL